MPINRIPASSPMSRMFSRMSPLRMWLNSCPITPCSSSRLSWASAPPVTAMAASAGVNPAANALMPGSRGMTNNRGAGTPEASDISSTMLTNLRSCGSVVVGSTGTAPTDCGDGRPALPQRNRLEEHAACDDQQRDRRDDDDHGENRRGDRCSL